MPLQLDLTASNPDNFVSQETFQVTSTVFQNGGIVFLQNAPFFAKDLSITVTPDGADPITLIRDSDFTLVARWTELGTANDGVYGAIYISNHALVGTWSVNYRALGGNAFVNRSQFRQFFAPLSNPSSFSMSHMLPLPVLGLGSIGARDLQRLQSTFVAIPMIVDTVLSVVVPPDNSPVTTPVGLSADPEARATAAQALALAQSALQTVPIATQTVLGGVKQGLGIAIAADGTISATGAVGSVAGVTSINGASGSIVLTASNLPGIGTAATQPSSAFATAAQGAKADTALQVAPVTSVAGKTGAVALNTTDIGGLGTAAAASVADFATAAQGLLAASAVQSVNGKTGPIITLNAGDVGALTQATADTRYATAAQGLLAASALQTAPVSSVNGKTGIVVLASTDIAGLGTAAAMDATAFATAAQGAKADTALQVAPVTSVAGRTGAVTLDVSDISGLGTAATQAASAFATAAQGANADTALQSIPVASATVLGGVKQGSGIAIAADGTITATGTTSPNATSSTTGLIQLAGDLGGTATNPTVPGLATKQATLVAGTNIKTIGGQNPLGAGDIPFPIVTTSSIGAVATASIGAANGVASLDSAGKVPLTQLPSSIQGAMNYQGAWDASTNTPPIVSGIGSKGAYYTVATPGTTTVDGVSQWNAGDHIAFNGTVWEKFDGVASEVISVAGRTGVVTLTSADVGLGNVPNVDTTDASNITSGVLSKSRLPILDTTDISGLGTSATHAVTDFATAAQGTKADSAVQSVNGKSGSAVTLAAADVGALTQTAADAIYASSAQGAKADSAVQTVNGKSGTSLTLTPGDIGALTQTSADARYIQTVNGTGPDASGNVTVSGGGSAIWGGITGSLPNQTDLWQQIQSLVSQLVGVNHAPVVPNSSSAVLGTASSVVVNLLQSATDADGNPLTITGISFQTVQKTIGTSFTTTYGTVLVTSDGIFTYSPNATAAALTSGQSAQESFSFITTDGQGANKVATITITVNGSSTLPTAVADTGRTPYNTAISGNVLTNDTTPTGTLSVVSFTVTGDATVYNAGTVATISSTGTIVVNSNGAFTFTPTSTFSGVVPDIVYTETNGTDTADGVLSLTVSPAANNIVSDPVTSAMTGIRTFDVGPGMTYTELDTVPWSTLVAGDVVNIYYRPTPYVCKVGIGSQGTATDRIIINGVTDANGNRPIISGDGARTASGSMISGDEVFGGPAYQSLGVITLVKKSIQFAQKPAYITLQNLHVTGANAGVASYDNLGSSIPWDSFACGIWISTSSYIDVINCISENNCVGFFTNSMQGGIDYNCDNIRVLYNRFYGNGVVNDDHQHNVYFQCYTSLFEGNYIGYLRPGAQGAAYKSRCGNEIVRYNWIEGGGSLLDMVQADGFFDGMVTMPNYDTSWVYGNVLITDETKGDAAYRLIHFGGDNQGEQGQAAPLDTSPTNYRMHLYFWNNTIYSHGTTGANQYLLKLSYKEQVCDWWNNIVHQPGTKSLHIMHYSGTLNIRGKNIFYSPNGLDDWAPETDGSLMTITRFDAPIIADPTFVNDQAYDFTPGTGSPALDLYSTLPANLPSTLPTDYPLAYEPSYRLNGMWPKTLSGNLDIGAIEYVPGAPPRSAPVVATYPSISGGGITTGTSLTCSQGTWLFSPTSYSYQWQISTDNGATWGDISNATTNTYVANTEGRYRCIVTATNVVNSAPGISNVYAISNVLPASVVQSGGGTVAPAGTVSYTFPTNPVVGNTIVAFFSGADSVTDTYGNVWTRIIYVAPNGYVPNVSDTMYATVVSTTGDNFTVSGTSTTATQQSLIAYEVNGVLDQNANGVGAWAPTTIDINVNAAGQLLLAVNRNGVLYGTPPYPPLNAPMIFDLQTPDGNGSAVGAFHAFVTSPGTFTIVQGDQNASAFTTTMAATFLPKP